LPEATLFLLGNFAREQGRAAPSDGQNPEQWSSAHKFVVVPEGAPLNEVKLAAYCRRKGLLGEQLELSALKSLQSFDPDRAESLRRFHTDKNPHQQHWCR
jgi:hypothetical protein